MMVGDFLFVLLRLPMVSLFLLPAVLVFMLFGVFINVSESLFVFDEVPLLEALFEIVGLFVLVTPGRISLEVLLIMLVYYLLFVLLSFHYLGAIIGFEAKGKHHKEERGQNFRTLVDSPPFWAMPTIWTGTVFFEISCLLCFVCFMSVSLIVFVAASLFFLPAVFVFVFVGEFVSVSVSVFVFVEVPLLVALFVIVGLLLLVIPKVFFGQCI